MSTFAKSFKDEVTRLARKEAKAAILSIRTLGAREAKARLAGMDNASK